jgi:CubicO group peptidase (beta-lactamase class C family)/heat shock protein HslJ
MLQANPWQWVAFTNPMEQFAVEDPASYTLTFNADGTVNIVADCNNANGTYTTDGSSLTIEIGPMTKAACPPESRSDQFITYLGSAAIYFFQDDHLFIDLFADGGTMEFTPVEADAAMGLSLTANPWQWTGFTGPAEQFSVEDPANYTLTFFDDGSLGIQADCNNVLGSYTDEAGSLTIELGPMTLAACPPESRSDQFITYMGSSARYFFEDGKLYIDLLADGGTLEFAPIAAEAAVGMSLTTNSWKWAQFTSPAEQFDVPVPDKYTLALLDDGSTSLIYADCNIVLGSYTVDGQSLQIEQGPATLADCGPESLSDRFLGYLQEALIYTLADGRLMLDLPADGGQLTFDVYDPVQALMEANRVSTWDEALAKATDPATCDAPGAVLLVDTPQGRYFKAQGLASTQDQTPLQPTDSFQIGSNTKSFTTVLALLIQEDGTWSLDDPLSKWLPEQTAKITNGDQITLRMLGQNHTGLPDYADWIIGDALKGESLDQASLEKGYTPEEIVDYVVQNLEPNFAPGEGWEYSTTNFILLGMAIEAATGQPIDQLYQARIFEPLGMENSFLLNGVPAENSFVHGYYTLESGEVADVTNWNGSQGWAGGSIVSTAEDMLKYATGISTGTLFSDPASLDQLLAFGDGAVGPFDAYGLGVGRWSQDPFGWGHAGQTPGFQSLFAIYPEQDTRVVYWVNSGSCVVYALTTAIGYSPELFTQPLP